MINDMQSTNPKQEKDRFITPRHGDKVLKPYGVYIRQLKRSYLVQVTTGSCINVLTCASKGPYLSRDTDTGVSNVLPYNIVIFFWYS